jgi:hypothetical protein
LRQGARWKPDDYSYGFVISAEASFWDARIGGILHAKAIVDGFGLDLFVGSGALLLLIFALSFGGKI